MYLICTLPEFDTWFSGLKDDMTRLRLARRLKRAEKGNLGDVRVVGSGVWEMREFFGPGWRGECLIIMLGGATQAADIARAIAPAETLED